MAGNCAVRQDQNEKIMPAKKNSTSRIDEIVASIIGVSRAVAAGKRPVGANTFYLNHLRETRCLRCNYTNFPRFKKPASRQPLSERQNTSDQQALIVEASAIGLGSFGTIIARFQEAMLL
jgi:hypothetical protein